MLAEELGIDPVSAGRLTRYQTLTLLCDEALLANKQKSGSYEAHRRGVEAVKARDGRLRDEVLRRIRETRK